MSREGQLPFADTGTHPAGRHDWCAFNEPTVERSLSVSGKFEKSLAIRWSTHVPQVRERLDGHDDFLARTSTGRGPEAHDTHHPRRWLGSFGRGDRQRTIRDMQRQPGLDDGLQPDDGKILGRGTRVHAQRYSQCCCGGAREELSPGKTHQSELEC